MTFRIIFKKQIKAKKIFSSVGIWYALLESGAAYPSGSRITHFQISSYQPIFNCQPILLSNTHKCSGL